tara:strand:- start:353 stop:1990 length:1638 start_codon:yes stop_codon:yes gene_type:complete
MNSKVLIIFIILVLIILMLCLITKNPNKEHFDAGGVAGGDAGGACEFDPVSQVEKSGAYGAIDLDVCESLKDVSTCNNNNKYCVSDASTGTCTYKRNGTETSWFAGETADASTAKDACLEKCKNEDNCEGAAGTPNDVCETKCGEYQKQRVLDEISSSIKYKPYPTDRVNKNEFAEIKADLISKLKSDDDADLQTALKENIYGGGPVQCSNHNNNGGACEANEQCKFIAGAGGASECQSKDIGKLNEIMQNLANLNNSGNDFVQQVGQLGEFQDKYASKIQEILEGRKEKDPKDAYITGLNTKLEKVETLFTSLNQNIFGSDLKNALNSPYYTITCLANNITLNVTPVKYQKPAPAATAAAVEYYYPTDINGLNIGAYMINLEGVGKHLFYYSYTPGTDPTDDTLCAPNNRDCSDWALTATAQYKDKYEELYSTQSSFQVGSYLDIKNDETWTDLQKRDGFFFILKINSAEDYNSILVKSDLNNIILPTDNSIKYPFYIVESARRPGYLLNVKSDGTERFVTVERANGQGTEKFSVTTVHTQDCV